MVTSLRARVRVVLLQIAMVAIYSVLQGTIGRLEVPGLVVAMLLLHLLHLVNGQFD